MPKLGAGGEPSTRFPPERLVEHRRRPHTEIVCISSHRIWFCAFSKIWPAKDPLPHHWNFPSGTAFSSLHSQKAHSHVVCMEVTGQATELSLYIYVYVCIYMCVYIHESSLLGSLGTLGFMGYGPGVALGVGEVGWEGKCSRSFCKKFELISSEFSKNDTIDLKLEYCSTLWEYCLKKFTLKCWNHTKC